MEENSTIGKLTKNIEKASTDFEKTNTEIKRKYLIWNIEIFNIIASKISVSKGSFGTGYPFYALDKDLKGKLPIITEQIRYNRQLVKNGKVVQKSIWLCESCLKANYSKMPDLKQICKPCPNMLDELKPRKIINRLPDIDMWLVCEDGCIEKAQEELSELLRVYNMKTSDIDPLLTIEDIKEISKLLKEGKIPKKLLPIDAHIIEYSKLKQLLEEVPKELELAKQNNKNPYLPIHPKSFRKEWQYDDEAYNFIYDYLSAFTSFNFSEELQQTLNNSRIKVANEYTLNQLFDFLIKSATPSNKRRFELKELQEYFFKRINSWKIRDDRDDREQ